MRNGLRKRARGRLQLPGPAREMKRRYARGRYDDLTVFAFFGLDMLYEKPKKKNLGGLVKSAPLREKDKQAR